MRRVRRGDAPGPRGHRRLVRLGLDAVCPVPRSPREPGPLPTSDSPPTSSARPSIRPAAGSTPCSPSRRSSSTSRRTATSSASASSSTRTGARCRSRSGNIVVPWDVINRYGADAMRWYFFTSKYPVGRLPLLVGDDRRGGAAVPAAAVEHVQLLCPLRQRERHRAARRSPRHGRRPGPVDALAPQRDHGTGHRAPRELRRDDGRARHPGLRRRALELVRAPLAPALLGRRPGRLPGPAHGAGHRGSAAGAVLPLRRRRDLRQPRRARAQRPPDRLGQRRETATRSSRRRWRWRAKPSGSGWPPAGRRG